MGRHRLKVAGLGRSRGRLDEFRIMVLFQCGLMGLRGKGLSLFLVSVPMVFLPCITEGLYDNMRK